MNAIRCMSLFLLLALPAALAQAQGSPASAVAVGDRGQRVLVIERSMLDQLGKLNKQLEHDPKNVTIRDLTNASLLILRTNGSPASAEGYLRRSFAAQDMDRSSRGFGTVPWKIDDPTVKDGNSIEFSMQALGAVFLGYGDHLSADFKKDAQDHLKAALVALANHHVKVSYTNIFLMNTMDTLELAEYLGDADALQRGNKQWQEWLTYTSVNGVHEFDSPTYYAVDLGDLVLGFLYVKDPVVHQQIKGALDMFWRDIASNYLVAAGHMAGAHSRDYNPLTGRGGIEYYLYLEGLLKQPEKGKFVDVFLEKVDILESERAGGYRVSQDILDIAKLPERVVQQRWDQDPSLTRYTYLTQDFAIGFATGSVGEQDKMFAVDLTGEAPLASITLVPDGQDSPYGGEKARDRSGHIKPVHLPLNLSGVQEKGTALLVADLDPTSVVGSPLFATNLLLPSTASRILLDKEAVKISSSLKESFGDNSILGVRSVHSCFVARIVSVDKLNGVAPVMELKADSSGLEDGTLRLAIYHAPSRLSAADTTHLHVALLVQATECKDDADLAAAMQRLRDAKVESSEKDGAWQGVAQVGSLKLALQEDLQTRRTANATVNDRPVQTYVFNLNGKPMGLGLDGQ